MFLLSTRICGAQRDKRSTFFRGKQAMLLTLFLLSKRYVRSALVWTFKQHSSRRFRQKNNAWGLTQHQKVDSLLRCVARQAEHFLPWEASNASHFLPWEASNASHCERHKHSTQKPAHIKSIYLLFRETKCFSTPRSNAFDSLRTHIFDTGGECSACLAAHRRSEYTFR